MKTVHGEVFDSGGGEVRVLVDRITTEYPTIGSRVIVIEAPPQFIETSNVVPDGYAILMADNTPVGLIKLEE